LILGDIMENSIVLGLIASSIYFKISESTVPKDSNCSYLAPASTDYLAMIAGATLISRSNDQITQFIGASILGIHLWQLTDKKGTQ